MNRELLYCILLLPLFLVAGCQNEIDGQELDKPDPGESPTVFTAAIESGDATKTTLGAPSGGDRLVKWSSNDSLRIGGARYDISEITSADSTSATFSGSGAEKTTISGTEYYEAFYPTSIYGKTGGTVTLTLPAEQAYTAPSAAEGNRVVISHLPMYARSEGTSLKFHNLCMLLNFQLTGAGRVDSVVVLSASKYLSGEFEIAGSETGGWYAEIKDSGTNRSRTVTLDCSAGGGVQLSVARPTEFCVGLPADTYPSDDLTVKVYSGIVEVATLIQDPTAGDFRPERSQTYEVKKAIAGFSVGSGPEDKVFFAPGNLQVNYTNNGGTVTREWLFSANQWDMFYPSEAELKSLPTPAEGTTVKLFHFGWATAGHERTDSGIALGFGYEDSHRSIWPHLIYEEYYGPYYSAGISTFGPSPSTWSDRIGPNDVNDPGNTWNAEYAGGVSPANELRSYCDWGIHFDDDGVGYDDKYDGTWFTLSRAQWLYLLTGRTDAGQKYGAARIENIDPNNTAKYVNGVVIVPDFWVCPAGCSFNPNGTRPQIKFEDNVYNAGTDWRVMEDSGAVFLPACGWRMGVDYHNVDYPDIGWSCDYWTSSASSHGLNAGTVYLNGGVLSTHPAQEVHSKDCARGVRLVHKCAQP